ncbi:hypothetical protein AMECASPLE_032754 [Ameca splendens]|uniref:Uncharacterized protein n=1 Tax=Ameca splendens TaxID=208324 RepID=A0ABV0XVK2_9TELE
MNGLITIHLTEKETLGFYRICLMRKKSPITLTLSEPTRRLAGPVGIIRTIKPKPSTPSKDNNRLTKGTRNIATETI